jgi:protein O-mannosyl-transferase
LSKKRTDKAPAITAEQKERSLRLRTGLLFLVFAFILYGNTIPNGYALDDEYVTLNNTSVMKGLAGIPEIFTTHYTEGSNAKFTYGYRPVVKATFAIENQFFGQNPHVSHFINVLLYALTAIVLFMLLRRLLGNYHVILPLLITLLFMAHPVHSEVVASLKNRDELLSFLGSLLTLHFVIRYIDLEKTRYLVYAALCFLLAFFSKVDAVTFLAVIPLAVWFFTNASWKKIALITGALAVAAGSCFLLVQAYLTDEYRVLGYYENPLFHEKGFLNRLSMGFYSLFYYLKILVLPHPLVYYYGYNTIPLTGWAHPVPVFSLLFYTGIGVWTLLNLRKRNIIAFAVAYFIITISMFANIATPVVGIVAERFVYYASLGFCIILAYALLRLFKIPFIEGSRIVKWNNSFIATAALLLILGAGRIIARNPAWKDHYTLYSTDIKHLGNSAKAHDMLGGILSINATSETDPAKRSKMIEESIRYYKRALDIYPDFISAHNNLASLYCNFTGDFKAAIPHFRRAIELDSSYAQAVYNLAFALEKVGEKEKAIRQYEKAMRIDSTQYPLGYTYLGKLYYEKGDMNKAIEINKKAIRLFPQSDEPFVSIGNIFLMSSDTAQAVDWWEKALRVQPQNPNLAGGLANYFRQKGNREKADMYLNMATSAARKGQ